MTSKRIWLLALMAATFLAPAAIARQPDQPDAAEIYHKLLKANVLGSALYVAAHPDDENTRLIAWLANEKRLSTGYIAMTRGDGGQNLIGPEIREGLGLIRTHELLGARSLDGGQQFFTRANDFGYSKHPDETFAIWKKEDVLADLVWTIRKFRPDVMITRFSTEPGTTHGHHTASAMLAEEAFEAAADPSRYPEQLKYVETWQPARLLHNTSWWFYRNRDDFDTTGLVKIDVGAYNPVLGESYTEMAAASRSMHKSQGFGASTSRGSEIEYLRPLKGTADNSSLMKGINTTWSRVKGGEAIGKLIEQAIASYDMQKPSAITPLLMEAYTKLQALPDGHWKRVKSEELLSLVRHTMGLYMEVTADNYSAVPGDSIQLSVEVVNRSPGALHLSRYSLPALGLTVVVDTLLQENQTVEWDLKALLPQDIMVSEPYWLSQDATLGMYRVDDQSLRGLASTPNHLNVSWQFMLDKTSLAYETPLLYKRRDPVEGEQYRHFEVVPAVSLTLAEEVNIFKPQETEEVRVTVQAGRDKVSGEASLQVPEGWKVSPSAQSFTLDLRDQTVQLSFQVTPPRKESLGQLQARATVDGTTYGRSLHRIDYNHLPPLSYYTPATSRVVSMDIRKKGDRVGYIQGAGDAIPESLEEIGYRVDMLNAADLSRQELGSYDAIILGVRAFNTVNELKFARAALMSYVENGGNLIVQYNTNRGLVTEDLAPYKLQLSRDRVTVEEAEVRVLAPKHPAMNTPNRIGPSDFEGWVQERGLYFPNEWDEHFTPVLSSNDPGETPKDGGLLIARYGKGYYIYTGYSWFRQLPAGVPGAYKIFTNLISLGG